MHRNTFLEKIGNFSKKKIIKPLSDIGYQYTCITQGYNRKFQIKFSIIENLSNLTKTTRVPRLITQTVNFNMKSK